MEAASTSWKQLGELLVGQGLLSHLQLETALSVQEQSGRKLGEILVERGFVTAAAVGAALAEQFGIELRPEPTGKVKRPVLRIVRLDEDTEIVDLPEVLALDHHRARLAEARLAIAQRDLRIVELENLIARLGHEPLS